MLDDWRDSIEVTLIGWKREFAAEATGTI